MPNRDIKKTADLFTREIDTNTALQRYNLTWEQFRELVIMCVEGQPADAVTVAFNAGFVLGTRAHNNGKVSAL